MEFATPKERKILLGRKLIKFKRSQRRSAGEIGKFPEYRLWKLTSEKGLNLKRIGERIQSIIATSDQEKKEAEEAYEEHTKSQEVFQTETEKKTEDNENRKLIRTAEKEELLEEKDSQGEENSTEEKREINLKAAIKGEAKEIKNYVKTFSGLYKIHFKILERQTKEVIEFLDSLTEEKAVVLSIYKIMHPQEGTTPKLIEI